MSQITCPHCGCVYPLAPELWPQYYGRSIQCAQCGQTFTAAGVAAVTSPAGPLPPPGVMPGPLAYMPPQPGGFYPPPARRGMNGWLIAAIVVGAVMIIPCLISILLPSLSRAREQANQAKCANNMHQIGTALQQYALANSGSLPDSLDDLPMTIPDCPAAPDSTPQAGRQTTTYIYLGKGLKYSSDPRKVLLYEPLSNHDRSANFLYMDLQVANFAKLKAQAMINDLKNDVNPPTPR